MIKRKTKIITRKTALLLTALGVSILAFLTITGYQAVTAYTQSMHEQVEAYREEVDTLRKEQEEQKVAIEAAEEAQETATREVREAKVAADRANSEAARANSEAAAARSEAEAAKAAAAAKASAPKSHTTKLTTAEIEILSQHIVKIDCALDGYGSGILFGNATGKVASFVATNHHVVSKARHNNCHVKSGFFPYKGLTANVFLYPEYTARFNEYADFVMGTIFLFTEDSKPILHEEGKRYYHALPYISKNESVKACPSDMPVGSAVYAMGYPRYAGNSGVFSANLIVSEGTIIGKAGVPNLPYKNYYTSAKLDSGMSGGAAFSKTADGKTCLLGMNTWVSTGNYENAGVIQSWYNIMHE